jgi:hypothetical protein
MYPTTDNPTSSEICAVICFLRTKTWVLQKSIMNYEQQFTANM